MDAIIAASFTAFLVGGIIALALAKAMDDHKIGAKEMCGAIGGFRPNTSMNNVATAYYNDMARNQAQCLADIRSVLDAPKTAKRLRDEAAKLRERAAKMEALADDLQAYEDAMTKEYGPPRDGA